MSLTLDDIRISKARLPSYEGIAIHLSDLLTETHEDWSKVRSPGRAARRRRRGHRQNIVVSEVPKPGGIMIGGVLYMHPESYNRMMVGVRRKMESSVDRMMLDLLRPAAA